MKKQALFVFGMVFVFSGLAVAQTKTVTNADLLKFKVARLKAEKDLRENYKELGFPSPEELKQRNEKSAREFSELSQRLRAERLEKERIAVEANAVRNSGGVEYSDSTDYYDSGRYYGTSYYYPGYSVGSRGSRNRRFRRNNGRTRFRGRFRTNNRNRNRSFGPSKRLTRQNRRKSRRNDIRGFGFGISIGGSRN